MFLKKIEIWLSRSAGLGAGVDILLVLNDYLTIF